MAYTYGNYGYAKDSNGNYITLNGSYIYQIRLGYQVNSQDIENNRSNISLQLEVRSVNSSYKTYGYNQTTTIDGTTLSAQSFDFRSTNTWQIFGTRTFDVTHNADGTYSVEKSASFTTTATGTGRPHSGSASVQVTLPTIPRASSITVSDANIGSSTNIVINKASSSFTTTLEYSTNNSTWNTIVTKTSNQVYGWTVPTSFYSLIPNAKTMTCYFRATTYSGNTNVGTKTTTATFTATGSPLINSSSATDVNSTTTALTGNSANMVKYASNVQVSINVSGQNSATISSVTVNGSAVSLSGTNPKTGSITINGATTNTFTIVATDTRGYQTTTTKTMTMVNYVQLSINANIKRNQPTDEKVNVNLSGNYFNASFGSQSNTLTVQYRYKESTSSSWGSWTTVSNTKSGNTYTASTQLSGMTYTKSYNFEVRATDKVGTKTITGITVTKGEPVYWWNDSGLNVTNNLKANNISSNKYTLLSNENLASWFMYQNVVDLSSLNVNTYYPVVADNQIPFGGYHRILEAVQLNSGTKPSWSTHDSGFTSVIDVFSLAGGWGTTDGHTLILKDLYRFANVKPAWFEQLTNNSRACFYLRGGGKYKLFTDWSTTWTIHTSSATYNSQTVEPTTTVRNTVGYQNATTSDVPTNTNQLTNGAGFVTLSGVVSEGTNTNGYWIKFQSGLMICSKKVSGTININSGWGNGYTSGDITIGSWAQTFTSTPEIQITPQRGSGGYNFWIGAEQSASTTVGGVVTLLRFTSATNVNYILHVTAIGKWK